jgi:Transglutaminase-like superfamily
MKHLTRQAYIGLIHFDYFLIGGKFEALYNCVRGFPLRPNHTESDLTEQICHAVDVACIWYFKRVLCLQRSAATTCLLRRYGIPAEMVIGAQQNPFRAHAWVEVYGRVVNDKVHVPDSYAVLDRC